MPNIFRNLQLFTGNDDVSLWVKISLMGKKTSNKKIVLSKDIDKTVFKILQLLVLLNSLTVTLTISIVLFVHKQRYDINIFFKPYSHLSRVPTCYTSQCASEHWKVNQFPQLKSIIVVQNKFIHDVKPFSKEVFICDIFSRFCSLRGMGVYIF